MSEIIGRGEIVARDGVIKQGTDRASAKTRRLCEPLKCSARVCIFFRVRGADSQNGKIELVEIVLRLFLDSGRELLFLPGVVAFGASQPTGEDVKRSAIAQTGGHMIERFAGEIEPAEAQRRRGEIKLAVELVGENPRDLRAPGNRFLEVALLGSFGQHVIRGKGIGFDPHNFLRDSHRFVQRAFPIGCGRVVGLGLTEQNVGAREQTFLSPAVINVGGITREDRAENKSKGRDGDEQRNLRWPGPAKQIGKRFEAASRWMFFSTPNASAFCRHRFCLSARRLENATGDCSADWSDG